MKQSDQWETPQALFDELNREFSFDMDACANAKNGKTAYYCSDYLHKDLDGATVPEYIYGLDVKGRQWAGLKIDTIFMNPPYSNPRPFIKKAWEDSKYVKVVMLIKADPSTKAWHIFWDYEKHQPKEGVEVRFFPARLKFERDGIPAGSAAFPSAVVVLDRRSL